MKRQTGAHLSRQQRRWPGWLVWLAVGAAPTTAQGLWGDTRGTAGVEVDLRQIALASANYDSPSMFGNHDNDGLFQTLLRLVVGGRPTVWLSFDLQAVQSLSFSTREPDPNATGPSGVGSGVELFGVPDLDLRYRALRASWTWADGNPLRANLGLDRFSARFSLPYVELTVGRQPIAWGKASFWNPLDVFLPFDPRQVNREYRSGVDALRADVPLGRLIKLNLIGALGRERAGPDAYQQDDFARVTLCDSALLARGNLRISEYAFALQGGKTAGGAQVGGGAYGEFGQISARTEAAYTFALDCAEKERLFLENHFSGMLGATYRFEFRLDLEAQYLFNGAGDAEVSTTSLDRVLAGNSPQMSQHLLAAAVTYELVDLLKTRLALTVSLSDGSGLVQTGFTYSLARGADILFGLLLPWGKRPTATALQSEFGTFPTSFYLEMLAHF